MVWFHSPWKSCGEGDGGEFGVGDSDAFLIPLGVVGGLHGEAARGGGRGDQFDDPAQAGEGPATPAHRDEREHAVLDPVPFRGVGRVVTHGDGQSGVGGELGEVHFPGA